MRKTIVITSVVMPTGWHKPESGLPEPIRANTFDELIDAVTKYRVDNGVPVGDVLDDIEKYICEKYPHMCHNIRGAIVQVHVKHPPKIVNDRQLFFDRIVQWMQSKIRSHSIDKLELEPIARQRASICAKCPFNQPWSTGCGVCADTVNRLGGMLRIGRDVAGGRKLKGCQVLGHENRSAVWLRLNEIENSDQLPSHCWAKR